MLVSLGVKRVSGRIMGYMVQNNEPNYDRESNVKISLIFCDVTSEPHHY